MIGGDNNARAQYAECDLLHFLYKKIFANVLPTPEDRTKDTW